MLSRLPERFRARHTVLLSVLLGLLWPGDSVLAQLRERDAARRPHDDLPAGHTEHGAKIIDSYFEKVWSAAGLEPARTIDDATFLRRASLALNGVPASRDEVAAFLTKSSADKRSRKVDELLVRSRYADYWGFRLRQWIVDLREVKGQGASMRNLYFYTREAMAENRSWARIARDLLASQADLQIDGAVNFGIWFSVEPGEFADAASRFFLGTNLSCARCHDHPYVDEWPRETYWGLAAFFARTKKWKGDPQGEKFLARFPAIARNPNSVSTLPGGDRAIDGGGGEHRAIYDVDEGEMMIPDAKEKTPIPPAILGGGVLTGIDDGARTRRERLVDWMTAPETPYFRRAVVHRFWLLLTGRGFVDRLDGFSPIAPVRHEALLETLSREFAANDYDLKWLLRTIVLSRVFQLEHGPSEVGVEDVAAESWHLRPRRPLNSDQWFDSVVRVTGEEERIYSLADEVAPLFEKEHRDRVTKRRETIASAAETLAKAEGSKLIGYLPDPPSLASAPSAQSQELLANEAEVERLKKLRDEYMELGKRQERYRSQLRQGMSPTSRALLRMNGELVTLSLENGTTVGQIFALESAEERLEAAFLTVLGRLPLLRERASLREAAAEAAPERLQDLLWVLMQTDEFQTF
jgi:hypothetical protein